VFIIISVFVSFVLEAVLAAIAESSVSLSGTTLDDDDNDNNGLVISPVEELFPLSVLLLLLLLLLLPLPLPLSQLL